ncbi:MAG: ECF transporter S component [Lachnospiraceae bacterium]
MSEEILKQSFTSKVTKTKWITQIGMMSAVAFLMVVVCRIPIIPGIEFLKYEPKDVMITIAGFILGPLASLLISLIVSFVEMVTISESGLIGMLMNVLSTVAFSCTAAFIYKKKRTILGAVSGLAVGCIAMTAVMLAWNYFITPYYMGYPREAIAAMLVPIFLPFNLIKSGLNMALVLLLYKPIVTALRKANLVPASADLPGKGKKILGVALVSGLGVLSVVLLILSMQGII